MKKIIYSLFILLLFIALPLFAAEKRWVTAEGTFLKQDSSISSSDVKQLSVGTELSVIEDKGRWLKVQSSSGEEGWIFAGKTASSPPVSEVSGESGLFGDSLDKSTIQTAKADSGRSIRGLSPETTQYAKNRGTPKQYRTELDKVLDRKITPKEVQSFMKEGKLGEYAD